LGFQEASSVVYRASTLILALLFAANAPSARFGVDLGGKPIRQLSLPDTRVVVLFFGATDCPISNRYIPEMVRLRDEFASRHVAFWWVFPNPEDKSDVVRAHQREFSYEGSTILDREQTLVRMAHVSVTPESAVFTVATDGRLRETYHGRVDNRYISLGQERPQPTRHDLEEAIFSGINNMQVAPAETHSVGCSIMPAAAVQQ
jgi:hypothetical protein